jgi:hypothetical protein
MMKTEPGQMTPSGGSGSTVGIVIGVSARARVSL